VRFPQRYLEASNPKVIVAGMTLVLEAVYDPGEILAGKSCVIISDAKQPLLAILVIVNSAAVGLVYREMFDALSLAGGYLRIGPPQVSKIRVPANLSRNVAVELPDTARAIFGERSAGQLSERGDKLLVALGTVQMTLGRELVSVLQRLLADVGGLTQIDEPLTITGKASLIDGDYLGWHGRYPSWRPNDSASYEGYWFPNGVAPPIAGNGPDDIPWDLLARVYPSYLLPGIDAAAWEAAAWEEFCDLLRKNKGKIGNARIRADLTGRGAITNPTGPMRKLQESFLKYHREIRENRSNAAEIDFLVDRIVFRLFDLTLDEQKLILSKVGPSRPLPPRRGKRKRQAQSSAGNLFD
jgi:hypothetical protein